MLAALRICWSLKIFTALYGAVCLWRCVTKERRKHLGGCTEWGEPVRIRSCPCSEV